MPYQHYYQSPIGTMLLEADEKHLLKVSFKDLDQKESLEKSNVSILLQAVKQLDEYFAGKRKEFTVPLSQQGTAFQQSVWEALTTIPYGGVNNYQDIAVKLCNPKAVRAVGMTNGKNALAIFVPCHRVIGKNGKLTGYAHGLWRKEWLLTFEQKALQQV